MNYARARLWLGITSVGTLVVLATAALAFDLPSALPTAPAPFADEAWALLLAFGAYVAVQALFDLLGGHVLPRRFGRGSLDFGRWFASWLRAVLLQGAWLIGLALVVLSVARAVAPWAGFVAAVVAMLLLLAVQGPFAAGIGGLRTRRAPVGDLGIGRQLLEKRTVRGVDHDDVGFTGGWVGWPGRETLLVPSRWIDELPATQLEAELVRRAAVLTTGARSRGVAIAFVFNTVGFALAAFVLGGNLTTVAGIATVALYGTIWSFLGALILPSLSRPAVYGADHAAVAHGVDVDVVRDTARQLDRWQDDEPRRRPGVEAVFHPIPAVEHRIEALDEGRPARAGAWHTARMALFLSWGTFGLLGRAVHCNCGRPELWVMLPAD